MRIRVRVVGGFLFDLDLTGLSSAGVTSCTCAVCDIRERCIARMENEERRKKGQPLLTVRIGRVQSCLCGKDCSFILVFNRLRAQLARRVQSAAQGTGGANFPLRFGSGATVPGTAPPSRLFGPTIPGPAPPTSPGASLTVTCVLFMWLYVCM